MFGSIILDVRSKQKMYEIKLRNGTRSYIFCLFKFRSWRNGLSINDKTKKVRA